jgi:hypothetical protein
VTLMVPYDRPRTGSCVSPRKIKIGAHLLASRKENPGVAQQTEDIAFGYIEPQIHLHSHFRYIGMRRTLSLLAIGALTLHFRRDQRWHRGERVQGLGAWPGKLLYRATPARCNRKIDRQFETRRIPGGISCKRRSDQNAGRSSHSGVLAIGNQTASRL